MLIGDSDRPPIVYGRDNESVARCNFIACKTREGAEEWLPGFKFQERGMYLNKCRPFIAVSVDGLYSFDNCVGSLSSEKTFSACDGNDDDDDDDDLAFPWWIVRYAVALDVFSKSKLLTCLGI